MTPCKAVIVHPHFQHTLDHVPETACLQSLPIDALMAVASKLSDEVKDLLRFEQVSKGCRRAADSELFWRNMCKSKFSVPDEANPSSWRALYRFNHEFLYKVILSFSTDSLMRTRLGGLSQGRAFNIPILA